MKILNVSQTFEIKGGSDVYFHALSGLLRKNGVSVDEFASTSERSDIFPSSVNFEKPTTSELLKYFYNREAQAKIKNFIGSVNSYDLAHLHIYYGKLSASILKPIRKAGIPIVQTLHEYKLVCPTYKLFDGKGLCTACHNNQFYHAVVKKCNRNSMLRSGISALESYISVASGSQQDIDHFITVSDFQKKKICEMGIAENKITTIHNFVNTSDIPPFYVKGSYVLFFGRIEKVKGIEVLLNAFRKLPADIPLVIAGDGEFSDGMLEIIKNSPELKNKVTWAGFKKGAELTEIIKNARFIIVPSIWYETFGLSVVEAMAHSKPVIGSDIGGISEIIVHGKNGYLFPPGDDTKLAENVRGLWGNDFLTQQFGNFARNHVDENFSPQAHFRKLVSLYRKIANKA